MIKLHDAQENFDVWINENQITSMVRSLRNDEPGTGIYLNDNFCGEYLVTETPEEILALIGESKQPAPVKNDITKRLEDVDGVGIPNSHRWIREN